MAKEAGKRRVEVRTIEQDTCPFGVEGPEKPITLLRQDKHDSQGVPGTRTHPSGDMTIRLSANRLLRLSGTLVQRQKNLDLQAVIDY